VLKARKDWKGAVAALRRAISLKPGMAAYHYSLAQVLDAAGDATGAQAELAEADRLRRQAELVQEAGVWAAVGSQKLQQGDLLAALDCYRRATARDDSYAPAHYQMGVVLQRLGEPDAARAAFTRAHQLNPSLVPPR
jgi:superkiller protein 3